MYRMLNSLVEQLVISDPAGRNRIVGRVGFDIDMGGAIPKTIKEVFNQCMMKREWSPCKGVNIRSAKPIFPVYKGTTRDEEVHLTFPAPLTLNVTDFLVIRKIDITLVEMYVAVDLSYAKLIIDLWPDVRIKL